MKVLQLALVAGLVTQVGCTPVDSLILAATLPAQPKPFQGMPENDPTAADRLAKESSRLWPVESQDPWPKVMDALLAMGYVITTSDASARVVSFERGQKEPPTPKLHTGLGYDSAVTVGTIRMAQENQAIRCALVLSGRINWRTPEKATRVELIPRLSPEEHKRFLDELFSKIST